MHSIRTKITAFTVCMSIIAMTIATVIGAISIHNIGSGDSREMLRMQCETGQKNLDSYFDSVEQSVEMVSSYIESDLAGISDLDDEARAAHVERVKGMAGDVAYNTNGVLTYYYRIDPELMKDVPGFWFVDLDGGNFKEHEPTDISQYDTGDTSQLVWFTVPKNTGKRIWLPPYITDNLDVRVISYNVPVYWKHRFLGVFGIEIDYSTMAAQVDNIKLFKNGYAFINDKEGKIIYHPQIDVTSMSEEEQPEVPEGLLGGKEYVSYTFDGVKRVAYWKPLKNGMRLNVSVPESEINSELHKHILRMIIISVIVLAIFILFAMHFTAYITEPLLDLTRAAKEVDAGNYDVELKYEGDDEVGILTRSFEMLVSHHNKGAFDIYMKDMREKAEDPDDDTEFAIAMFDCDDLKTINDSYGHEKGDIYLKRACNLICRVFRHSPVFRIGGDEFAAILTDDDYRRRNELALQFEKACARMQASDTDPWEKVSASFGIAVYDPEQDHEVTNTVKRADDIMYGYKRSHRRGGSDDDQE